MASNTESALTKVIKWAVYTQDYNTAIAVETDGLGLLNTEDVSIMIDDNKIEAKYFDSGEGVGKVFANGNTGEVTINVNSIDKSKIERLYSQYTFTGTSAGSDTGNIEFDNVAGFAYIPFRFVMLPYYSDPAGTYVSPISATNNYGLEFYRAYISTPFQLDTPHASEAVMPLTIKAMVDRDKTPMSIGRMGLLTDITLPV